jgi:hypothetical protein
MKRVWNWWLDRCDKTMDARPLALMRILLPLCVIADLLRVVQLGLLDDVFLTYAQGGLSRVQDPHLVITDWFGASAGGIVLVITLVCMALSMAGVWFKPALLVGILAYSQLGHLYPPGDRAIDRLVRSGLLVLLFSNAHKRFSLSKAKAMVRIPAWPADFIRFLLVVVYLSAGLAKLIQQPGWLSLTAEPPLLRIMTDPMAADLEPLFWSSFPGLFRLGGFGTILFELSSPLLLTRHAHKWAVVGVFMHLGIAATMTLGMFSWGMLSFYPLLLAPFILPRLDRHPRTQNPSVEQ